MWMAWQDGSWKDEEIPVAQRGKDSKEEGDEADHSVRKTAHSGWRNWTNPCQTAIYWQPYRWDNVKNVKLRRNKNPSFSAWVWGDTAEMEVALFMGLFHVMSLWKKINIRYFLRDKSFASCTAWCGFIGELSSGLDFWILSPIFESMIIVS